MTQPDARPRTRDDLDVAFIAHAVGILLFLGGLGGGLSGSTTTASGVREALALVVPAVLWLLAGGMIVVLWRQGRRGIRLSSPSIVWILASWAAAFALLDPQFQPHRAATATQTQATRGISSRPREAVRKEAAKRSQRSIQEVACGEGELVFCVVTFAGPACQLWFVDTKKGPLPLGPPVEGATGSASGEGTNCAKA